MEKRFYFDSGRDYFGSIKIGEFFTDSDPIEGEAYIYMRIDPIVQEKGKIYNVVNLETGVATTWLDDDRVYPVKSAEIDIKM